ncbi:unnamed protein product [Hymenolepis diminuta]|uniref:Uncharacterized protein n=1 Tax=Hymenolepis diminuta TaxID=6216 RepID=A0A564XWM3_HYMDI|nr:unnamed protein product [Hymenolepis diminuta]
MSRRRCLGVIMASMFKHRRAASGHYSGDFIIHLECQPKSSEASGVTFQTDICAGSTKLRNVRAEGDQMRPDKFMLNPSSVGKLRLLTGNEYYRDEAPKFDPQHVASSST